MMNDTIIDILNDIDEDITAYNGDNLLTDGVIDSFTIMEIVNDLSEKLDIDIPVEFITRKNFRTVSSIVEMVKNLL